MSEEYKSWYKRYKCAKVLSYIFLVIVSALAADAFDDGEWQFGVLYLVYAACILRMIWKLNQAKRIRLETEAEIMEFVNKLIP